MPRDINTILVEYEQSRKGVNTNAASNLTSFGVSSTQFSDFWQSPKILPLSSPSFGVKQKNRPRRPWSSIWPHVEQRTGARCKSCSSAKSGIVGGVFFVE